MIDLYFSPMEYVWYFRYLSLLQTLFLPIVFANGILPHFFRAYGLTTKLETLIYEGAFYLFEVNKGISLRTRLAETPNFIITLVAQS